MRSGRTRRPGRSASPGSGRETVIQLRARVRAHGRECTQRQVHGDHRRRRQPLVPHQPAYRATITALVVVRLRRRQRRRHEPLRRARRSSRPMAPWSVLAFARDWGAAAAAERRRSWHYVHSDQWRYRQRVHRLRPSPPRGREFAAKGTTMDLAVGGRAAWAGCRSTRSSTRARSSSSATPSAPARHGPKTSCSGPSIGCARVRRSSPSTIRTRPQNWPRVWFIWRGNALHASAKGHEYFLRHYLGTHDNAVAPPWHQGHGRATVTWRDPAPRGKMDLVVDLNFRMDTSALYSDIVLPAASWYEKDDLNTTDLHSFIHPLSAPRCRRAGSRSTDWDIFRMLAAKVCGTRRPALPGAVSRSGRVAPVARHAGGDRAAACAATGATASASRFPASTMPHLRVVERDYVTSTPVLLPRPGPARARRRGARHRYPGGGSLRRVRWARETCTNGAAGAIRRSWRPATRRT